MARVEAVVVVRHYRVIGSEPLSGETVCDSKGSLTPFPKMVRCPACLDWIASNHRAVQQEIQERTRAGIRALGLVAA